MEADKIFDVNNYKIVIKDNSVLIYQTKGFWFGGDMEKFVVKTKISDIEIVYYDVDKNAFLHFVVPTMTEQLNCGVGKRLKNVAEVKPQIIELRKYLLDNGATDRAKEPGFFNFFKAAFTRHSRIEEQERKEKEQRLKAEIARKNRERLRANCQEFTEEKYTCHRCNKTWYVTVGDQMKNLVNACNTLNGSIYSLNHLKDPNKCPHCGSAASTHKKVKFWRDKKGNIVDSEE